MIALIIIGGICLVVLSYAIAEDLCYHKCGCCGRLYDSTHDTCPNCGGF